MYLDVHKDCEDRMKESIDSFKTELQKVRVGRANPALLEGISVEYYGQNTPLNQVASISVPEPRQLTIQPWDKTLIPAIETAILKSDLGINPSTEANLIRLQIPALTEERRKDLAKTVRKNSEDAKVVIRNIRREGITEINKLEKAKELTEDEERTAEEKMQELTDKYIAEIDAIAQSKEDELMEI